MKQVSESELVLMQIIWKHNGSALYSEIMDELEQDTIAWKKNTVLTLLSRLIEKKYLKTSKIGHRNEYTACITEQEYQASQTHHFLNKIFKGNVKHLVSTLLQQDIISAGELKEIERFWEQKDE